MEFTDLGDRLSCSICLNIFIVPVTLRCGHNFCRECITHALDTQDASGVYSCPECRDVFQDKPLLQANSNLQNIVEIFYSKQPDTAAFINPCTYCMDSFKPAVKTCMNCESSMCFDHLKVHSKSHTLIDPTTSLEDRKCSIHKKKMMFYCYEDAKCICANCCLGDHMEHKVEMIDEASEKKKEKLRSFLGLLNSKRERIDRKIQNFQEDIRERQEKALELADMATALFRNIRRQLEVLEKNVLTDIFRKGEEFSKQVSGLIEPLEVKKDDLSRKIQYIEKMCNMTDPIALLQDQKSDRDDFCVPQECDRFFLDDYVNQPEHLDLMSKTIHTGLYDIVNDISSRMLAFEASDIILDVNTAAANISVSYDMKTVCLSRKDQSYPESPERFKDGQMISLKSFSSGWHYWDVETSELGDWMMGLAYASIDRQGEYSWLGENTKSWCLTRFQNQYSVIHDGEEKFISHKCLSQKFRIYLDYRAGRLSFYELGDSVKHLYTFTTIFTEPLHAAFGLVEDKDDCWLRIIS
ncbi:E3 ubiquitin/ISG15 ligase TRIM25-like [Pyxicephalus adspersus]|uniref:Uncharacterized protein n=1 Tax=Pyxicephalus adspersus TaxID=30357 RepID=A0AAV3AMB7_PYXAD|nr:TPA: hypothetical protein GDO54_008137 [Pyxicephalus adspersus]